MSSIQLTVNDYSTDELIYLIFIKSKCAINEKEK